MSCAAAWAVFLAGMGEAAQAGVLPNGVDSASPGRHRLVKDISGGIEGMCTICGCRSRFSGGLGGGDAARITTESDDTYVVW